MATPGFSIGGVIPNLPVIGQTFRNIPIPNFRPAIYGLAVREPSPSNAIIDNFLFPLSPESVRTEYTALNSVYDVAGTPQQNGVQRIIDQYGNAPPLITIEGTTGWQFHGQDGYLYSGLQAMQNLENMMQEYALHVQSQMESGETDLAMIEFYDFFRGQYWEVVPVGRFGVRQDRNQPLIARYFFRFAATRNLNGPNIGLVADNVARAFALTQSQAAQNLDLNLVQMGTFYAGMTYASFLLPPVG